MILGMTRGIRKTKMKEEYFNRGSSDCNNSKSTADYLCLFYQVSWLELLQKVKSIRCSTLQRQILVYCCLQPVQTLQLVVFHGAQSPSEIKRSHMQCSASWQSYLHIAAKELLVLLVVVPNGKALRQDSCKLTPSSFIVTEKCWIISCGKILRNKYYHAKALSRRLHLNGNIGRSREGPRLPLIFRPNWGLKGGKKFLGDHPPPHYHLKVWIWHWVMPKDLIHLSERY